MTSILNYTVSKRLSIYTKVININADFYIYKIIERLYIYKTWKNSLITLILSFSHKIVIVLYEMKLSRTSFDKIIVNSISYY